MREGDVSEVVPVNNQFVVLKCEKHLPGRNVPLEQVRKLLEDAIREKKLRLTSTQVFERLQAQSQLDLVYTDPARSAQEPGVAARINGRVMSTDALAVECAKRHGTEVLEGMIGRKLLEQAARKAGLQVTQADMDAEVAHAAVLMGKTTTPGGDQPDIPGWLKQVTESQEITVEQYMRDTVWPSAALKKLVIDSVRVTDEDLQRGYEANYGPRFMCRAIVLNQMRRAQEVWQLARDNPTAENFGLLAEQYSIDSVSRTLRGEVPPIQRHGGQPMLEKEAFALQPGELSGIIQIGETYVVLLCEGRTEPRTVEFAAVRDLIYGDVYEKKLRVEMAKHFDRLQAEAHVDNFLAGTVKSPTLGKSINEAANAAQGRATPASFNAPAPETGK
jgi:parvulin-like peptidyl-prolyl isomerase